MSPRLHILAAILLLGGACATPGSLPSERQAAEPQSYLAGTVAELAKPWPGNRTVNVVCHGHSVPAGYFRTPTVDTFNAYPHLLHQGLKVRFPLAVVNVIVTAIGGETSDLGAARFDQDVLSHHPDVVTIDYGLNDRRIGLEQSRKSLVAMIEMARDKDVEVILLTPTGDLAADIDNLADPLNQQAAMIRQLAGEYRVGLVDSLAEFQACVKGGGQLRDLMSQGNHPNRRGHDLVARKLLDWFPEPSKLSTSTPRNTP